MTRLHATHQTPGKPISVALGEMAIAAGLGGQSLTLCYRDYPAPLLCELWKYFAQSVDANAVYHVRGQSDIRKIPERIGDLRLILVHSPHHHNSTAWTVQMAAPGDGMPRRRPTVFSHGAIEDADDDPGATLLLRCDADELRAITQWLVAGSRLHANWANASHATSVVLNSVLGAAVSPRSTPGRRWPTRFRDSRILQGLLTGACMIRSLEHNNQANVSPELTFSDYGPVRTYLQSPTVCPVDEPIDTLAADMINRANVYLGIKFGDDSSERNPFYVPDRASLRQWSDAGPPRHLITRKEIADLGNTRSGMVRKLVEYLHRTEDGYDPFVRMGLRQAAPGQDGWPGRSAESLTALLRSWSVKQVRTHFERLQEAGLIAAARERANGPWLYTLPEELTDFANPFRDLPTATELGENIAGER